MRKNMTGFTVTQWSHHILSGLIPEGGICIDATAGTGQDTVYLARAVGENGKVIAFDIQEEALRQTDARLQKEGLKGRVHLVLDSHVHMDRYGAEEEVDAILFNFGYLPGGDHRICTKADTSVRAVDTGLRLLRKGGVMGLCIYSGGDTGFEEKEALLSFLARLDSKKYLVIRCDFYNRGNHPPIPVLIIKQI